MSENMEKPKYLSIKKIQKYSFNQKIILKISKYVSLSSISTALIVLCITPFLAVSITAKLCMLVAVILLVYRHKDNIKRIKNHTESKIQWM